MVHTTSSTSPLSDDDLPTLQHQLQHMESESDAAEDEYWNPPETSDLDSSDYSWPDDDQESDSALGAQSPKLCYVKGAPDGSDSYLEILDLGAWSTDLAGSTYDWPDEDDAESSSESGSASNSSSSSSQDPNPNDSIKECAHSEQLPTINEESYEMINYQAGSGYQDIVNAISDLYCSHYSWPDEE